MSGLVAGWARWGQEQGLAVFPVAGVDDSGQCRCYRGADCSQPGKHPSHKGWQNKVTRRDVELALAFPDDSNIGVVTGEPSGILTVDIDCANGKVGEDSVRRLVEDGVIELPGTLTLLTGSGSGSRQLVYRIPRGETRKVYTRPGAFGSAYPDVDVKGDGGFFVAPPSLHRSGSRYEWEDVSAPLATAPAALLDAVTAHHHSGSVNGDKVLAVGDGLIRIGLPEGGRNRGLYDLLSPVANSWGEPDPGPELIHALACYALWLNERVCKPPLPREEVSVIVGSVVSRSKASRAAIEKYSVAFIKNTKKKEGAA